MGWLVLPAASTRIRSHGGGRRGEKGRMGWVVVEGPQGDGHRGLTVGEGS